MSVVGVLLHGADPALRDALVARVARRGDLGEVRAVEQARDDAELAPACRRLVEVCDVVLGVPADPWPGWGGAHEAARQLLGDEVAYWAVESWHGLPGLGSVLADRVVAVAPPGARVLLTAPDHAVAGLPAEQRAFLREAAEGLAAALPDGTPRPTVAVDRSPDEAAVTPTAASTVTTLAEAHGALHVVRCSLVPDDGPDADVTAAARAAGLDLVDAAMTGDDRVALLLAAVATLLPPAVGAAS